MLKKMSNEDVRRAKENAKIAKTFTDEHCRAASKRAEESRKNVLLEDLDDD